MPVIVPVELYYYYLSVPPEEVLDLKDVLKSYPADGMIATVDDTST